MKMTKKELKAIILEELNSVLLEAEEQKVMDKWKETPEEEKEGWLDKVASFFMKAGKDVEKEKVTRRDFLGALKKVGFGLGATAAIAGPLAGVHGYMQGTKKAAAEKEAEKKKKEYEREYAAKTGGSAKADEMPVDLVKWSLAPAGDRVYGQYVWINPKELRDDLKVPTQNKTVGEVRKEIQAKWGTNRQQLQQILNHISDSKSYGYSQSKEKRLFDPYPGTKHGDAMDWDDAQWNEHSKWFQDNLAGKMMLPVIFSITVEVARQRWLPILRAEFATEKGLSIPDGQAEQWAQYLLYSSPKDFKKDIMSYDAATQKMKKK